MGHNDHDYRASLSFQIGWKAVAGLIYLSTVSKHTIAMETMKQIISI